MSQAEFDTSRERQQVQAFESSLKALEAQMHKLDRTNLDRLSKEIEDLARGSSTQVSNMATQIGARMAEIQAMLQQTGRLDYGFVQGFRRAKLDLQKELNEMKVKLAAYHTSVAEQGADAALREAKAQAKRDKDILQTRLANIRVEGARLRLAMAAERRQAKLDADAEKALDQTSEYRAALKAMADKQADEDRRYVALRKDSLARGKQLIIQAAKTSLVPAAMELDQTSEYRAALKAMADKQADEDRRYVALRKDSLARGKQLIIQAAKESLKTPVIGNIGTTGRTLGGAEVVGAYSAYDALTASSKRLKPVLDDNASAFRRLAIDGGDAHSMARGLASSFGLLWLTWGNLVPLFTGAGISYGLKLTATTGMEVAHTMAIIAELGGNTSKEMAALSGELTRLGYSGIVGPREVAESMKVLSLAGLKANEILGVTQDVLNFSVAGTTDLKTAADSLVSISTAFGMGAAGFGRVSDVVSKAAAESKTSVESFSNAMKTASVIHKQYGVSLEDTATALATMAQLGIEGTAAGTALRNMYADLSGRSGQVAKVLKSQGIELRDVVTGGFRPLVEVVGELNDKFQRLDAISQKNLMQALLSERGAKGLIEALDLISQTSVGASGQVTNALAEMRRKIEDSYGFAAISAAKLAQTADSQFKALTATIQTSMNEAYKGLEPQLLLIFDGLKKTFASPEFVSGLQTLVGAVGNFVLVLAENAKFIGSVLVALGALKIAQMGLAGAVTALTALERMAASTRAASTAVTVADTVATNANTAAKTASAGALGMLARVLPGISTAITVAAGAWMLYEYWSNKSKNNNEAAANLYNNNVAKALSDEADRLEKVNALRRQGLTYAQAQQALDLERQTKETIDPLREVSNEATRKEFAEYEKLRRLQAEYAKFSSVDNLRKVESQQRAVTAAVQATTAARAAESKAAEAIATQQARVVAARKAEAKIQQEELAAASLRRPQAGIGKFSLAGDGKESDNAVRKTVERADELLSQIEAKHRATLQGFQAVEDSKQRILENSLKNQLISEGTFAAQSLLAAEARTAKEIELLKKAEEEAKTELERALTTSNANRAEELAAVTATGQRKLDIIEGINERYDNAQRRWNAKYLQIAESHRAKVENSEQQSSERIIIINQNLAGALAKIRQDSEKYWQEVGRERQKSAELAELSAKYAVFGENVIGSLTAIRAAEEASINTAEKHAAQVAKLEAAYLAAKASYVDFQKEVDKLINKGEKPSEAMLAEANARKGSMEQAEIELAKFRTNVAIDVANASATAYAKAMQAEESRIMRGIASSIETALFEGGKSGRKKLRDLVVSELRKPVSMVINVAVNALLGSIFGSFSGLLSGGAAGGGAGVVGNLLTGASLVRTGAGLAGGSLGAGFNAGVSALFGEAGFSGGMSAGMTALQAGNVSGGVGTMLGAASPLLLGAIALNALGLFRRTRTVGGGLRGTLGEGDINAYDLNRRSGTLFSGPSYSLADKGVSPLSRDIQAQYVQNRANIVTMAESLNLDVSRARNFTTTLGTDILHPDTGGRGIKLDGLSADEANKKIQEALATANNEIAQQILGTWTTTSKTIRRMVQETTGSGDDRETVWREVEETITETTYTASEFAREGETAIETLTRLATSLTTVNGAFDTLGYDLLDASLAGGDLASKVVDAFGGVDKFLEATNNYYTRFYSDLERRATSQRQLDAQFSRLGTSAPKSKEEFRKLVDSIDITTEAGQKLFASLMALAPSFDEVYGAIEQERKGLQNRILELEGKTAELRALELAQIDPSNRALQERVWALEDEAAALERANAIASERQGLQTQLWELEGNTAAIRAQELAQLDPSNRALQERIWALEDEAEAIERANAIAAERQGLQTQLWELEGNTAAIRAQELAQLDSSNRALQQRIWALKDEAAAQEAAEQASNKAYEAYVNAVNAEIGRLSEELEAASKIRDTFKSLFDFLKTQVTELRDSVASTAGISVARGQAILDAATASGVLPDQETLSGAVAAVRRGIDTQVFSSRFEETRARLSLAAQLEDLQGIAGSGLGGADQQVSLLQSQIDGLKALLAQAELQHNTLRGIASSNLTIAEASAALLAAYNAETARSSAAAAAAAAASGSAGSGYSGPMASFGAGASAPANLPVDTRSRIEIERDEIRSRVKDGTTLANVQGSEAYGTFVGSITAQSNPAEYARLMAVRQYLVGAHSRGETLAAIAAAGKSMGFSQNDIAIAMGYHPQDVRDSFSAAGIPAFAVGTNYVPNDMIAQIHKGEMIVPAAYNPSTSGVSNEEVVAELRQLRALFEDVKYSNLAIAGHTNKTSRVLSRVTRDGESLVTTTV